MSFSSFQFNAALSQGIAALNYQQPTPIQSQAIPCLLTGQDLIGCAQTGTGKTAAFSLPLLQQLQPRRRHPQALILAPTRELAEQITQAIKALAKFMPVKVAAIYGGVAIGPQERVLSRGVDIVVATPGRLLDHLQRRTLQLQEIQFLVLDEADRMMDMGFMPDIKRIIKLVPTERQTMLFSATMPPEIEKLARSITRQPKLIMAGPRSATADNVAQKVFKVSKPDKMGLLVSLLAENANQSAIVFSRTKHGADKIARQLGQRQFSAARIHSDRSQAQRQNALDSFRQGSCRILVATDIAARGIDVDHVGLVINYDTPVHAEDYVHRIGRTGRASAVGEALTFTSLEEQPYLQAIEKLIGRSLPLGEWKGTPSAPMIQTLHFQSSAAPKVMPPKIRVERAEKLSPTPARPARQYNARDSHLAAPRGNAKTHQVSQNEKPRGAHKTSRKPSSRYSSLPVNALSRKIQPRPGFYPILNDVDYLE